MLFRTPTELGAIIRQKRRALGLDQKALADRVGVSRQWVIEIEKGKARSDFGLILRTLSALGISLDAVDERPLKRNTSVAAADIDAIIEAARRRKP